MLTTLLLLLAAFLACACALGFDPAFLRAGLWIFLGFAVLNILFVIFWVAVAQTVDDSKPIERQKPIYRLGVAIIAGWLCWWARVRVKLSGADKLPGWRQFSSRLLRNINAVFPAGTAFLFLPAAKKQETPSDSATGKYKQLKVTCLSGNMIHSRQTQMKGADPP